MERYAIIGFGCAGYHALKAMRDQGFEGEIHVYSELGDPPASPMLTTYYVSDIIPRSGLYPFGSLEEISAKYRAVIHRDCRVTALDPETKTVTLDNGKVLESDILVMCVGTRARTELVQGTAVNVQRGILVGDDMSTSVSGIYAAGDCTQGRNLMDNSQMIIGLWANAGYQGETAGRVMAGGHVEFTGNIPHNLTHFMGMDFVSFGDIRIQGETRRFGRPDGPTYIRVTVADDRVVAVNILDIYQVSGIIRNYMLGVLAGSKEPMSPALKGYLSQVDMEQEFIDLFRPTEGDQHDGT